MERLETSSSSGRTRNAAVALLLPAVLLAAVAGQRLWLIAHNRVIAKDGTYFLGMARALPDDPAVAMEHFAAHPGYPAAVVAVRAVRIGWGGADDFFSWETAGTCVAFAASLLAILGVWVFAARAFRNVWIAFFGALLFGLGRKFAALGADVLSDSLMLCFALWGLVAALETAGGLEAGKRRALAGAAATGLLAAAAYWVRPEGMVVLVVAVAVWTAAGIRRRGPWGLTLAAGAMAILLAGAAMAPYGFTHKWRLSEFAGSSGGLQAFLAVGSAPGVVRLLGRFFEAQHPIVATLTCLYLLAWGLSRIDRFRDLRRYVPRIDWAGGGLILITWLLISPILILRYRATGAMSHRYLMLPAAMMAGLAGAAMVTLARLAAARVSVRRAERVRRIVLAALMVGLTAGLTAHALRPLHENDLYAKRAGLWLAKRVRPGDKLLTDQHFVDYYARASRSWSLYKGDVREVLAKHSDPAVHEAVRAWLDEMESPRFVAFTHKGGRSLQSVSDSMLQKRGYRCVRTFPYVDEGKCRPEKSEIFVYETNSTGQR